MPIEIKQYQEEFLDEQVRITFEVTTNWKYQPQLSLDGLKKAYSAKDFDPSTRLYAFSGDKMVGCLSAAKTEEKDGIVYGSTRTPFVLKGFDEAKQLLFEKSVEALRRLGVNVLQATSCDNLGYSKEFLGSNGFEQTQERFILAKEHLRDLTVDVGHTGIIPYHQRLHEIDLLDTLTIWAPVNTQGFYNFYKEAFHRKGREKTSWQVYYNEGKLSAFSILMRSDRFSDEYRGPHCFIDDNLEDKQEIVKKLYAVHVDHFSLTGHEKIQLFLPISKKQDAYLYESLGFSLDTFYNFEKKI